MLENTRARKMLKKLPVEHLFTYKAELAAHVFDTGFGNTRMFTQVSSGSFEGPDLRGHIAVGPSSESAIIRPDGVLIGDVNLLLVTDDDAEILMRYTATAIPNERGYTVRNYPIFETAHEKYTWINLVQAISLYSVVDGVVSPSDVYRLV